MAEPTTEQWKDLHVSFMDFCKATPWRWLDDTDLLVIEHPSGEYRGYCAVLGGAEMEYGMGLYVGDEGLAGYLAFMTGEVDPESTEAFHLMCSLSALLADREDLDTADRAVIRGLGLSYRGRGSWPMFRSAIPGYMPWYLNADEAVFLTMALRNVTDIASRVAGDRLILHSERDPSLRLTRVFVDGAWQDRWEPFRPPKPPAPVRDYPDTERLQRLARSRYGGTSFWEVSIFHLHTPIQEDKGERPYFPTVVLVVDRDSSSIVGTEVLGAGSSITERQDVLVELMERMSMMPTEIVVDSAIAAQLVEPITRSLGVRLSVGATPALREARGSLMTFIDR